VRCCSTERSPSRFGWLAWRRGLEAAIASHIVADVLLITTQHLIA
jgi:hypothetical protein